MKNLNFINYILEVLKITIPAMISVGVVMLARYYEKKKEYENKIREKKVALYEKFFMAQHKFIIEDSKTKNKHQREKILIELQNAIKDFTKDLMFWGSSDVIKAYNKLQTRMKAKDHKFEDFEDFYFALRKDVGHSNRNLKTFDLLRLILRADEFDEKGKPLKSTLINNNPDLQDENIDM